MNYFGREIHFIFSKDLNGNTAKGAGDLVHVNRHDMNWFRTTTLGCVVIMGYKTYMTLDKPLEGRLNVVYSELPLSTRELREGFKSHQDSYEEIQDFIERGAHVFCIGGVQTFKSLMKHLNSMPEQMLITTHKVRAEDGNCPADFLDEILHLYQQHEVIDHDDFRIDQYWLGSDEV